MNYFCIINYMEIDKIKEILLTVCSCIKSFDNDLEKFISNKLDKPYEYEYSKTLINQELDNMFKYALPECLELDYDISQVMSATDIHGDFYAFINVLYKFIKLLETDNKAILIFTGDYLDRGPDEMLCLILLVKLINADLKTIYFLRGNHDTDDFASSNCCNKNLKDELYKSVVPRLSTCFRVMPYMIALKINNKRLCFTHSGLPSDAIKFNKLNHSSEYSAYLSEQRLTSELTANSKITYKYITKEIERFINKKIYDDRTANDNRHNYFMSYKYSLNSLFSKLRIKLNEYDSSRDAKYMLEKLIDNVKSNLKPKIDNEIEKYVKVIAENEAEWNESIKNIDDFSKIPNEHIILRYDIDSIKEFEEVASEHIIEALYELFNNDNIKASLKDTDKVEIEDDYIEKLDELNEHIINKIETCEPEQINYSRNRIIRYLKFANQNEISSLNQYSEDEIINDKVYQFNFDDFITLSSINRHIITWSDIVYTDLNFKKYSGVDRCRYGIEKFLKAMNINNFDIMIRGHQSQILSHAKRVVCTNLEKCIELFDDKKQLNALKNDISTEYENSNEDTEWNEYDVDIEDNKHYVVTSHAYTVISSSYVIITDKKIMARTFEPC